MIGSWLAYAAASDPDATPYDLSFWRAGLSVAGTALTGWLAHRRSRATIPAAIATAAGTIALGALVRRGTGSHVRRAWDESPVREAIFNEAMPVVHAAQSAALVAGAVLAGLAGALDGGAGRAAGRDGGVGVGVGAPLSRAPWYHEVRKLALYYMGFSLVGHWGEILFCLGIKHGIFQGGYDRNNRMLWDQWLYPFPAEGTAAVLAELVLSPAKRAIEDGLRESGLGASLPTPFATLAALGASFLVNQVACTAIDYGTGMVANRNFELWDYRDMPFNFQGQICLQNSLFYTTVATLGVWALLPALGRAMDRAGDVALDGTLVGFGAFFAYLELLYHVLPGD